MRARQHQRRPGASGRGFATLLLVICLLPGPMSSTAPHARKRTIANGAMVLAVPPVFRARLRSPSALFEARPPLVRRDFRQSRGPRGDALGLDNGAHTADAYWMRCRTVRAGTPGSIRPLLVGRRALTYPGSLVPRLAAYSSRSTSAMSTRSVSAVPDGRAIIRPRAARCHATHDATVSRDPRLRGLRLLVPFSRIAIHPLGHSASVEHPQTPARGYSHPWR